MYRFVFAKFKNRIFTDSMWRLFIFWNGSSLQIRQFQFANSLPGLFYSFFGDFAFVYKFHNAGMDLFGEFGIVFEIIAEKQNIVSCHDCLVNAFFEGVVFYNGAHLHIVCNDHAVKFHFLAQQLGNTIIG